MKGWIVLVVIVAILLLISGGIFSYLRSTSIKKVDEKVEVIKDLQLVQAKCWLECPFMDAKTASEKGLWNIREEDAIEYGGLENMYQIEQGCYELCNSENQIGLLLEIESLSSYEKSYINEKIRDEILPVTRSLINCNKEVKREAIRNCLVNQIEIYFPEEDISNLKFSEY